MKNLKIFSLENKIYINLDSWNSKTEVCFFGLTLWCVTPNFLWCLLSFLLGVILGMNKICQCYIKGDVLSFLCKLWPWIIVHLFQVQVEGESRPFIRNVFTLGTCAHIVGSKVMEHPNIGAFNICVHEHLLQFAITKKKKTSRL